jgi:hypothetical protein
MKKLVVVLATSAILSSCHYLQGEARETLETNEKYKSEKAEYSVNRANVDVPKSEAAAPANDSSSADAALPAAEKK